MAKPLVMFIEETVASTSSSPELGGYIDIQANERCVRMRWEGEREWGAPFEWYELMVLNRQFPKAYTVVLEEVKEKVRAETIAELVKNDAALETETYKRGYDAGLEAGSKLIRLSAMKKHGATGPK